MQPIRDRVLRALRKAGKWGEPASIPRVLGAMGLSSAVPEQAGCRAPPGPAMVRDLVVTRPIWR